MYDKSEIGIMVLDVPDSDKQAQCELFRMGSMGVDEYNEKYKDLKHLYYSKSFFEDFARKKRAKYFKINDQNIEGYCNNLFRFNFILVK
jgi:hypothetical protein